MINADRLNEMRTLCQTPRPLGQITEFVELLDEAEVLLSRIMELEHAAIIASDVFWKFSPEPGSVYHDTATMLDAVLSKKQYVVNIVRRGDCLGLYSDGSIGYKDKNG